MYVVGAKREALLDCLPKGGRVAEIGVYTGDFSDRIYQQTVPMELHLIDPWEHQEREDYSRDDSNVPQEQADQHYQQVLDRFAPQIECEVVKVHREYSANAVTQFPDGYFDWIYIDALHTYEACLEDLRLYAPKVKANGFICGHDYANHPGARHMDFGVVEAVNQFVRETGYEFLLLTYEAYPTYVISKSGDHEMHRTVFANALVRCGILTEVKDALIGSFQQTFVGLADGTQRMFYSFG